MFSIPDYLKKEEDIQELIKKYPTVKVPNFVDNLLNQMDDVSINKHKKQDLFINIHINISEAIKTYNIDNLFMIFKQGKKSRERIIDSFSYVFKETLTPYNFWTYGSYDDPKYINLKAQPIWNALLLKSINEFPNNTQFEAEMYVFERSTYEKIAELSPEFKEWLQNLYNLLRYKYHCIYSRNIEEKQINDYLLEHETKKD